MKKMNGIKRFAILFLCACLLFSLMGVTAMAADETAQTENTEGESPKEPTAPDLSADSPVPEETPAPAETPNDTEKSEMTEQLCEKCGSALDKDGVCPVCEEETSERPETTATPEPAPDAQESETPAGSEETPEPEKEEDIPGDVPVQTEDTGITEPSDAPQSEGTEDQPAEEPEAQPTEEPEAQPTEEPEAQPTEEPLIADGEEAIPVDPYALPIEGEESEGESEGERIEPSYLISIPVTFCRIDEKEKTASLTIDVNCQDGFEEGDRVDVSFSSENDMTLICGELGGIPYILRNSSGSIVPNHATIASFHKSGTAKLSLEVSGSPSYAGEYRDILTFTVTFIPGETGPDAIEPLP